jgi:hypothetical protein
MRTSFAKPSATNRDISSKSHHKGGNKRETHLQFDAVLIPRAIELLK